MIQSSLSILKERFPFIESVSIRQNTSENEDSIFIKDSVIDPVPAEKVGKTIEGLIRMVYDELNEEAGLYFITELKEHLGKKLTRQLLKIGIEDRKSVV